MGELAQAELSVITKDCEQVAAEKAAVLLQELPDWQLRHENGIHILVRTFVTKDYTHSLQFTNAVAQLAESVNHHPRIVLEYASVGISWWTHDIGGLHMNDFILAHKCAELL